MKGIKQPSLLDLGEPEIDLDFPGIVRIDLGEGAWVEHLPNWLKGHQDLFETLRERQAGAGRNGRCTIR